MAEPKVFYVLACLECGNPLPIPFGSAAERGKWAAEHTRGTGHDRWLVKDQTITGHRDTTPPAPGPEDLRIAFTDPVSDQECALVIPPRGKVFPAEDEPKIGIAHPRCDALADLAIGLDAFFCPRCTWNGRVSGAWCADILRNIRETTEEGT